MPKIEIEGKTYQEVDRKVWPSKVFQAGEEDKKRRIAENWAEELTKRGTDPSWARSTCRHEAGHACADKYGPGYYLTKYIVVQRGRGTEVITELGYCPVGPRTNIQYLEILLGGLRTGVVSQNDKREMEKIRALIKQGKESEIAFVGVEMN